MAAQERTTVVRADNPLIADAIDGTISNVRAVLDFLRWVEFAQDLAPSGEGSTVAKLVLLDAVNGAVRSLDPLRAR